MALQLSVAVRTARLEAIETTISTAPKLLIFSGAVPANCAAADPAGLLATIILPSDWMSAASAGSKALLGSWSVAASGAGTALSFRIKDTANTTCHIQGTVGLGSGDLSLDNTAIASGQTVQVTTLTLTDGNA
jgi:hypothetical protein